VRAISAPRPLAHDSEKWIPVSRLREARGTTPRVDRRFGGRRQVGKHHAARISESVMTIRRKVITL
jgi:hypothetical protein